MRDLTVDEIRSAFGDKTFSRGLDYFERGYYSVSGAVEELEEVKKIADKLMEEGHFKDAADVFLLLVEESVDAFEYGFVDDSDGILCFLVSQRGRTYQA
jgi:hypothetical protein